MILIGCISGVLIAGSLAEPATDPPRSTCADAVAIEATAQHTNHLLEHLRARPELRCDGAQIGIVQRNSDEVRIEMTWRERYNSRSVRSMTHALVWLESWLESSTVESSSPKVLRVATPSVPEESPTVARVAPSRTGRVQFAGTTAFGSDAAAWLGGEVSGRIDVIPQLWLGAVLGGNWEPASEVNGFTITRKYWRAGVRVGTTVDLANDLTLTTGGGVGVINGNATEQRGTFAQTAQAGGPYVQLTVDLDYRVAGPIVLVGGVAARVHDSTLEELPAAVPVIALEGRLGVAYVIGGGG